MEAGWQHSLDSSILFLASKACKAASLLANEMRLCKPRYTQNFNLLCHVEDILMKLGAHTLLKIKEQSDN